MTFYAYTCPECGSVVRLDYKSDQLRDIKVCVCESPPLEVAEEL